MATSAILDSTRATEPMLAGVAVAGSHAPSLAVAARARRDPGVNGGKDGREAAGGVSPPIAE